MTKSLLAIGGLGVAGCVLLSLMMQELVGVQSEREATPLERELGAHLDSRRCGPVRSAFEGEPGQRRLVVRCRVHGSAAQPQLARSLGLQAWRRVAGTPDEPREVVVQLSSPRESQPFVLAVPRHEFGR